METPSPKSSFMQYVSAPPQPISPASAIPKAKSLRPGRRWNRFVWTSRPIFRRRRRSVQTRMDTAPATLLTHIQHAVPASLQLRLLTIYTKSELKAVCMQIAKSKSSDLDNIGIEFYLTFWNFLGAKFTAMVHRADKVGSFPPSMTSGTIALLLKDGDREQIGSNSQPIILLNTSYKILPKGL